MAEPSKYFVNNIAGTTILLDEIINSKINKFVFSSTCATYGIPSSLPIDETLPANPINPYGQSKLSIEAQLRWLGDLAGLRWIALRYFNAAGADSAGEIGEAHEPETHLIPLVLKAAAPGNFCLSVYGNDYPTNDGTAIRDYIHVEDLACAHVKALDALKDHPVNDSMNLGTGVGVSVRQVIETVAAVTGYMPRHIFCPRRPGDPPELVANSTKAEKTLNWTPSKSSTDVIVADAWQWYNKLLP
jgi:UDP-glucose-4-epimerase GalE